MNRLKLPIWDSKGKSSVISRGQENFLIKKVRRTINPHAYYA